MDSPRRRRPTLAASWTIVGLGVTVACDAAGPIDAPEACVQASIATEETPDGTNGDGHLLDVWVYANDMRPLTRVLTVGDGEAAFPYAYHEWYTYDDDLNLVRLDTGYGDVPDDSGGTTWTWDDQGQMLTKRVDVGMGTIAESYAYTWDGDLLVRVDTESYGHPWYTGTYTYDEVGELLELRVESASDDTAVETWTSTWDGAGNRLTETYDIPGQHSGPELVTTFGYDDASHVVTEAIDVGWTKGVDGLTDEWRRYTWEGDALVLYEDEVPEGTIATRIVTTYGDDGRIATEAEVDASGSFRNATFTWTTAACP